ncbi:hypothetical protein [Pseudomonas sivasensis]|uniref:hypothetical protein n=1 Tax=Pseudomonas sivasensis TaxID=1880678 RepID=UPI0015C4A6B5|nr:hypothetical protein [Pseudomonas sivasensis]
MNITKIYEDAKAAIEYSSGTFFLFQIAPKVEDFCVDECFRLAQQDTRKPADRPDLKQLPRWQQQCAAACMAEFHACLSRIAQERLEGLKTA